MDDDTLLLALDEMGVAVGAHVQAWTDAAPLLAAFEGIGRAGANALVKVDGGRTGANVYTVVLSGGPLGEAFFRKDGAELAPLLREALAFYVANRGAG